ncbi:hypothetical protein RBA41_31175 [Massilia sp. CCM 9210]|uniref:hypothetical protein n=1 Tax=Massilia scottii TaxID=3057166 RepID=UPI0027966C21|nr:hypothetical protein [Massilia sp. CCM 9210]MDQ1817772.1 hypothetical protein [Massilia sp. CCM 9210]
MEQAHHYQKLEFYLLGERLRKLYLQLEKEGNGGSDQRLALELDNRIGKIPVQHIEDYIERAEALLARYGL